MPPRYMEILRSRGPVVHGVLLADTIAVPTHWVNGVGLIACLGSACRFHVAGICNHPMKLIHFAPAQRCEPLGETAGPPDAAALERFAAFRKAEREGKPFVSAPVAEKPADAYSLLGACIAEITDRNIDKFRSPMRGIIYSLEKSRGKLIYTVKRPGEPIKGMGHEFDVVPILERIFGMPLFPPEAEQVPGEPARVLPFRKQA